SSKRRHTISYGDWSSDVCSSDLELLYPHTVPDVADVHGAVFANSNIMAPVNLPVVVAHAAPGSQDFAGQIELEKLFASLCGLIRSEERRVGKEGWFCRVVVC